MKNLLILLLGFTFTTSTYANLCLLNSLRKARQIRKLEKSKKFKVYFKEKVQDFIFNKKWSGLFYSYRFQPSKSQFLNLGKKRVQANLLFDRDLIVSELRKRCLFGRDEVAVLALNETQYRALNSNQLPKREFVLDSHQMGKVKAWIIDSQINPVSVDFRMSELEYHESNEERWICFRLLWQNPLTGKQLLIHYLFRRKIGQESSLPKLDRT